MPAVLTVFGLGVVEVWFAVPAGFALGLDPWIVWACTLAGSILGVGLVAVGGDRLRSWFLRRRGREIVAGTGRIYGLWVRYGVVGWGLLSPLVVAPPMGTAIGLALGAPRRRLFIAVSAGAVLWTTILVGASILGIDVIHRIG
jgi:hypothetical protein